MSVEHHFWHKLTGLAFKKFIRSYLSLIRINFLVLPAIVALNSVTLCETISYLLSAIFCRLHQSIFLSRKILYLLLLQFPLFHSSFSFPYSFLYNFPVFLSLSPSQPFQYQEIRQTSVIHITSTKINFFSVLKGFCPMRFALLLFEATIWTSTGFSAVSWLSNFSLPLDQCISPGRKA